MKDRRKQHITNSRVVRVEKSSFTPMVFSTFGGMGKEGHRALQRAAARIAERRKEKYADVMGHNAHIHQNQDVSTEDNTSVFKRVSWNIEGNSETTIICGI